MLLDKKRLDLENYFEWRRGDLRTLLSVAPTQVNGLSLVPPEQISTYFNYFAAVSRFYTDAMLGDIPDMSSEQINLLTQMTEHWAVAGECCVAVSQNGNKRAIRPDYVFPVHDKYDKDTIEKFVFVFPYVPENTSVYGSKARVIEFDVKTGASTVNIRDYHGGYVSDDKNGAEDAGLSDVIYISGEDSLYKDISGIVREVIMRLNIMQVALNATAFPILQIDTDSIGSGTLQDGISQQKLNSIVLGGLGLTILPGLIGEQNTQYIERAGTGLAESLNYLRMLLGQLGVLSGVPDYVFGVQLDRPAAQTERVLFAGQAKVNRFRRDVEDAFKLMDWDVHFTNEPFSTKTERVNALINQFDKQIITKEEVRLALGWDTPNRSVIDRLRGR